MVYCFTGMAALRVVLNKNSTYIKGTQPNKPSIKQEDMTVSVKVEANQVEKGKGDIPVCGLCRKCFATVSARNLHIRTLHEGECHACQGCDKVFTRKGSLNQHIRAIHQGEKPHHCTECGKDFTQKTNLSQNIKSFHQDKKRTYLWRESDVTLINHVR